MNPQHTLLILDDDVNVRSSLTRLFRRDGYRLLEASNSEEALALLGDNEVGVILCEPHIQGAKHFLRQAKERFPLTRRVVLSGYTALKSVTDAINAGSVHKFFTKPWEDDALRAEIGSAFEQYQTTHEAVTSYKILSGIKAEMERRVAHKLLDTIRALDNVPFSHDHADALPVGVVTIEQTGKISFANFKARQILSLPTDIDALTLTALPTTLAKIAASNLKTSESLWGETEWVGSKKLEFYCQPTLSETGTAAVIAIFLEK